jgi:integrase
MARTKKKAWSYSTGERGRNRVRVFEHRPGIIYIEFYVDRSRKRHSLEHGDRIKAKTQADEAAARFATEAVGPKPQRELTLGELFDNYDKEVSPTKSKRSQKFDKVATAMFSSFFGHGRKPSTLGLREWDRFVRARLTGRVGPGKGPWREVGPRTAERDLRLLLAVFNWAAIAGDGTGGVLLERNPFRGFKLPREKNPNRPITTTKEYQALLAVASEVDWRFRVALVLAYETGHRIGSIRHLRWSDIDTAHEHIVWRAEHEKTGQAHTTPMTQAAAQAISLARGHHPGIGDAPLLPSAKDGSCPVGRYLPRDWWHRAERLADMERVPGRGWHSLRRRFATDLMEVPLKVLCELGGWKTPATVLACYQRPNEDDMRAALGRREKVKQEA